MDPYIPWETCKGKSDYVYMTFISTKNESSALKEEFHLPVAQQFIPRGESTHFPLSYLILTNLTFYLFCTEAFAGSRRDILAKSKFHE